MRAAEQLAGEERASKGKDPKALRILHRRQDSDDRSNSMCDREASGHLVRSPGSQAPHRRGAARAASDVGSGADGVDVRYARGGPRESGPLSLRPRPVGRGLFERAASSARQNFNHVWVVEQTGNPGRVPSPSRDGARRAEPAGSPRDASRPASLLLGYIRQVCALVAPRRPGASAAKTWPLF